MNINDLRKELFKLRANWPHLILNAHLEVVLNTRHNIYFSLYDVEDSRDIKYKLLSSISRSATKGVPKATQRQSQEGINKYLGTNFTETEFDLIYTKLGNGINKELGYKFIDQNYDLELLKGEM